NLTISVDLVDVRNKRTLWGEQFERKISDLLATQREIASAITEKLQLKLSGSDSKGITKQYTSSNEAYQLYLKGRYYWNKRTAESIKKSVALDPLSLIFINNVAETYIELGELDAAYNECQRIIELDPNFWAAYQTLVWVHVKQGKFDEALLAAQKGVELSNRSNSSLTELGYVYGKLGRTNDAKAIAKELEEIYAAKTADGTNIAEV